jgi:tetratricopeptide (TPR) repeat protein
MKIFLAIVFSVFLGLQFSCAQTPTEKVFTEKDKERNEMKTGKEYFAKKDECFELLNNENYKMAEISCKSSISIAEKLPKTRYLEKRSAYNYFGIALLKQNKAEEAIGYLNKALEVSKPNLDDTDSETGEVYYILGQANLLLRKFDLAREFYIKAENAYRAAFKKINADELRQFYPKAIKAILESHLILEESEGSRDEAIKIQKKLDNLKTEFPKFLDD